MLRPWNSNRAPSSIEAQDLTLGLTPDLTRDPILDPTQGLTPDLTRDPTQGLIPAPTQGLIPAPTQDLTPDLTRDPILDPTQGLIPALVDGNENLTQPAGPRDR